MNRISQVARPGNTQSILSPYLVSYSGTHPTYSFTVDRFTVSPDTQNDLPKTLGTLLLESYRDRDMLLEQYRGQTPEALTVYLENYVFPTDRNGNSTGRPETAVRSGDFGEIIMARVAEELHNLTLPCPKMMWKLRKDRSSFCTDIFAHNAGTTINDLHYFEVKTRKALQREGTRRRSGTYLVGVVAHDSLARDQDEPTEQIADFLRRQFFQRAKDHDAVGNSDAAAASRQRSADYGRIVDGTNSASRNFWIALVLDRTNAYSEEILSELENLPPELRPIKVSIVLLDDLQTLISSSFKAAFAAAIDYVYGGNT